MAKQLIESLTSDFEPEKYRDEYRERVLDLIERKAQGETVVIEAPAEEPTKVPDLMAALEASIAALEGAGAEEEARSGEEESGRGEDLGGARPASRSRSRAGRSRSRTSTRCCTPFRASPRAQVIDYYTRIAPVLLPHLRDRPLTLKRYPNGVDAGHFYEKHCPSHAPEWVRKERVDKIDYCVCDDLPTLVWLANLADLELHPSLSLVDDIDRPTVMAFDLDPGPPAGLAECCEVAFLLRDALAQLGLESFAEDLGLEGHPGVRAAQHRRRRLRPRHQAALAGACAPPGGRSTRS